MSKKIRALINFFDGLVLKLWLFRFHIGVKLWGADFQLRQISRAPSRYLIPCLVNLGATVKDSVTIKTGIMLDNIESAINHLKIAEAAYLGPGVFLDLAAAITIEGEVVLSPQAMLLTHGDVGDRFLAQYLSRSEGPILLKKGCWIGSRAIILPGITVGTGAVVGAGAVVTADVPDFTVVVGVPAREIRKIR